MTAKTSDIDSVLNFMGISGVEADKFVEGASWYWELHDYGIELTKKAAFEAGTYIYSIGRGQLTTRDQILDWVMHLTHKDWVTREILNAFCLVALDAVTDGGDDEGST